MFEFVYVDIETRSRIDLRATNVYRYVADDSFAILAAGWAIGDGEIYRTEGHVESAEEFLKLEAGGATFVAHSSQFERVCFSAALGWGPGDYLSPELFECTATLAREHGLPGKLDFLAKAVLGEQKDSAGSALIRWFCVPDRNGDFRRPEDHPEKWAQFMAYMEQDVATHRDAHRYLKDWPNEHEKRLWYADQRINDRGIKIDVDMAVAAKRAAELNAIDQKARIRELTGVTNPGSVQQMMAWVADNAVVGVDNMQAATIERALTSDDLTEEQREVLELRAELALASSKKFGSALEAVLPDGRLRGTLAFYGAHTARWAGRGTQVQNLPRASFSNSVDVEMAILDLLAGERLSPLDLKRLVRPLFVGPFTVVDYSAIEARVIAWLAGEQWALDAFALGRDIYVETAERMSTPSRPLTRSHGKVAVLALGFAGGINSLRAMGADGSDDELKVLVVQWRKANPKIVRLWSKMEEAFGEGGRVGEHVHVTHSRDKMGKTVHVHLPSGRAINYHAVRWERYTITDPKTGKLKRKEGWRFADPAAPHLRIGTYGGRLTENIVQATARDLLGAGLVRLDEQGYPVVAHVHDEVIVEGEFDVEEIASILCELPSWAKGLPMNGEGMNCERYQKG